MINHIKQNFRASWDKRVWVFSVIFFTLLGLVPMGMISYVLITPSAERTLVVVLAAIMLAILAVNYLPSPQAYTVEPGHLTIKRPGMDVTIPLDNVDRMEIVDFSEVFHGAGSLAGGGGALGVYGSFWNNTEGARLKNFTAYVTHMGKAVVILHRSNGNPIVVSPDEIEAFMAAVEEAKRGR